MGNTPEHLRSSSALLERRHHPREKISEVSYVDLLDGRNGGLVLDISESGLLLQTALKVTPQEVSRLRFRLPTSDRWIEARARIVWIGKSGKEAGVQFLELSEKDRTSIGQWIANRGLPGPGVPGERIGSQQTTRDSPAPAFLPSFVPPKRVTKPSWRGLAIFVVAIAIVAVLLGLTYSPQLPRLPILNGPKPARNAPAKTVKSPSANDVTRTAAGTPQAPSSGRSRNPIDGGAASTSSSTGQTASAPFVPKGTESTFGNLVTQTLPPDSATTKPNAADNRSQARSERRAPTNPPSTATADAPKPSQNTILVGAPAVGSPPARVILETEPVTASSNVAVTASRSILVPGSERPTEKLHLGKLVSYVSPGYPVDAREKEIEGIVRVRAFIGASGQVRSVRLLSGPAALAPAAMNAVRRWRFGSTVLNGQTIETQADVSVFFRLH